MISSKRVLFIVKCRGLPYSDTQKTQKNLVKIDEKTGYTHCISSGLFNSANLVSEMLFSNTIQSKVVQVIDANCIDREVHRYKPTHVMIEALWVVPEKFEVLQRLHPDVKWVIRLHSETPFIANEGIAIDWIYKYAKFKNVFLAPNSTRMFRDLHVLLSARFGKDYADTKIFYLPNYYKVKKAGKIEPKNYAIDIGCFGAIRPLKNQLTQAVAAIEYAKRNDLNLRFHMNTARIENNGNNVLKNIRALFDNLDPMQYLLVEHDWLEREEFLGLITEMDVGLQVSFSETFNIVTADFVSQNVPVVTSDEVSWVSSLYHADPTDVEDMVRKIDRALSQKWLGTTLNRVGLEFYNFKSKRIWLRYIRK